MNGSINNFRVSPITSPRSGEAVRNQYAISAPGYRAFQSYDSLIAVFNVETGRLTLGRHFDYSVTTSKYLHVWLKEYAAGVWYDIRNEYQGKSLKDTLQKAIDAGAVDYDPDMV